MLSLSPRRFHQRTLVSLVIPCFNEEAVLPLLFERVREACDSWDCQYEVILVDDGSADGTWELLQQFHDRDERWKAIRLSRNFGHQLALWTGLQRAEGDVIVVLDADLQDPPEVIAQFLAKWEKGYDVVFAVRQRRKENWLKRSAYFLYYRLLRRLSEIDIPLDAGDFCLMDRRVLQALMSCQEQQPFIRGLRAWVGFRQTGLAYERAGRAAGDVKYTLSKLMKLGLDGIFGFSSRPLRIATWLGVLFSSLALVGVCLVIVQRLFTVSVDPIATYLMIILAVFFLGGIQLISIGILGAYVGRIFQEVKNRPLTIAVDSYGFEQPSVTYNRIINRSA
jgi:dolichol-phosphate mannosyltransferase